MVQALKTVSAEDVLLEYVERYGLTEQARRYFLKRQCEEEVHARAQTGHAGDDSDAP